MLSQRHPRPFLRARTLALARQMDWFRGLRAGVALCAPLVLGDLAGIPNMGWAALGGFEAILADTGGPYRARGSSLTTLALGGAIGLFVGSVCGRELRWALPATALFCFMWSYLAVLGSPFNSAGLLVQVIFICGIGAPTANWHQGLNHSLLLLAGGAWAALLSLLLWPLDAWRPARFAVAACYRELASFLGSIIELAGRPGQRTVLWHRLATHHQYRMRRTVELGWQAVASIRAEHKAETAQGHHLVVLLEHADLLIARTIALAEHFEARSSSTHNLRDQSRLSGISSLRAAEAFVAQLLVRRGPSAISLDAQRLKLRSLPGDFEDVHKPNPLQAGASTRFLLTQVTEAASLLDTAVESASLLRLGGRSSFDRGAARSAGHFAYVYARLAELNPGWNLGNTLDQLRANFTIRSLLLRHATRVAVVCGIDLVLIFLLNINHGYWLLMTSLIVLQPHVSGTMRRGLERIGGTVGGGILAALLALVLHGQLAIAAVLFPLALLALAILPVSYAAYAFFLTPAFVLAWLPFSGDWQLALVRIADTITGALIALLAMAFLFPIYERDRAPEFLRASLEADRRYLAQLAESWRTQTRNSRLLANARRAAGLAHNDTEESLERLLAESWPRRRPFARFVAAFVTYLRRFSQSVTALTALDGDGEWKTSSPVRLRLELLDRQLQWLIHHTGPQPASTPWPDARSRTMTPRQDHPGDRLLQRLERQAEILHRHLNSLRKHGWIPGSPR